MRRYTESPKKQYNKEKNINNKFLPPVEGGTTVYKNVKYPKIPFSNDDTYVITRKGDRLDNLALTYYNDASLWWVISITNPNISKDTLYPPIGIQIRIPSNPISIKNKFNSQQF